MTPAATVAVAACRRTDDSPPDDLYPDPDAELLVPALLGAGASSVDVVSWDDPGIDWSSYDLVLISSTWDSVDRPDEYLGWARSVPRLVNPPEVVAWNLDKRYLADLESVGLPIVPTTWIGPGDPPPTMPPGDVVVKPSVSAGGRSTAWYSADRGDLALDHLRALQRAGATVMVQGHVPGVASVGEIKGVYVGGVASHAVRVGGLLVRDAGTMERPWEQPVPVVAAVPSAAERAVGDAVVAELSRRFGRVPVYARVDLVLDAVGAPRILEVELIDPMLFLGLADGAAVRLAQALLSARRD